MLQGWEHVPIHWFPREEEAAHVVTHGMGLVLSTFAAGALIWWQWTSPGATTAHLVGSIVYGVTLVILYAVSTLYHAARRPHVKRALRVADHSCVYLLIAGTYTPFMLTFLWGPVGWAILAAVWVMALAGITLKLFCTGRYPCLSNGLCLAMGWLCLVGIGPLLERMPPGCFAWLLAGGIFYTVGVVFYVLDQYRWFHTIWHFFVLAGSFSQFIALARYGVPGG